jgi:hypothetical protein
MRSGTARTEGPRSLIRPVVFAMTLVGLAEQLSLQEWLRRMTAAELEAVWRDGLAAVASCRAGIDPVAGPFVIEFPGVGRLVRGDQLRGGDPCALRSLLPDSRHVHRVAAESLTSSMVSSTATMNWACCFPVGPPEYAAARRWNTTQCEAGCAESMTRHQSSP